MVNYRLLRWRHSKCVNLFLPTHFQSKPESGCLKLAGYCWLRPRMQWPDQKVYWVCEKRSTVNASFSHLKVTSFVPLFALAVSKQRASLKQPDSGMDWKRVGRNRLSHFEWRQSGQSNWVISPDVDKTCFMFLKFSSFFSLLFPVNKHVSYGYI